MSQVIVLVYSNGKKFEGPQGLTFEGQKRAIQIKRGISYDTLKKMIGAKLKLESHHHIISSLTYRFPTSQSTYTDLEIFDSEDVECMIIAAEKNSHVNIVLELYVEIGVVGGSSSIPIHHLVLPTKTLNSPSSNYANNIGLSNNDEDRSRKDEDGAGVPNDESSDAEVAEDFNDKSNVVGLDSSIVAASPFASPLNVGENPQPAGEDSRSSPPSSPIQQPRSWTYHVFLNFRGVDTRRGFTDHLYASLERKGIITYRDDKNLGGGEMISTELLKAIEESMIAITIFSPNYASSIWCLDELQKIVECKHNLGQFVVPIFYDVEPSDVRYQKGHFFKEAFHRHELRYKQDQVSSWRNALREVTSYSGFDSRDQPGANFVDSIAEYIHKQLMKRLPSCTKNLASRVEELIRLIDIELKDVRFAYMGHNRHLVLPNKTSNSPSSNYANNIGLSNDDKDRSSKDVDGGGVPDDESSDNTEVAGDFNANSNVELASSIVGADPYASSFRDIPLQAGVIYLQQPSDPKLNNVHMRTRLKRSNELAIGWTRLSEKSKKLKKGEDSCSSPSSSIPQPQPRSWTYHVFLGYREADTRRGFTDHLYASLERKGIIAYSYDKNLGGGEMISTELHKAIEESMIAIIVFSENYASSTWCLDELQKIVECKHNLGQFVVPIFYRVEPYEVRLQRGRFEEAFARHEERFRDDREKVLRWREALREVVNYSGFASRDKPEANFVDGIAEYIHKQVMKRLPSCTKNLASRVEELIRLIDIELKDVRFAYMGHNGWHT